MPTRSNWELEHRKRVDELIAKLRANPNNLRDRVKHDPVGVLAQEGFDILEIGTFLTEIGYPVPAADRTVQVSVTIRNAALAVELAAKSGKTPKIKPKKTPTCGDFDDLFPNLRNSIRE